MLYILERRYANEHQTRPGLGVNSNSRANSPPPSPKHHALCTLTPTNDSLDLRHLGERPEGCLCSSSECSDDPKDATFGAKLQVTVLSGTSKPPLGQSSKSHSHSITRREEITLSELEAAVVEADELTRVIVDNKVNVKPSYSMITPLVKSIKHHAAIVTNSS